MRRCPQCGGRVGEAAPSCAACGLAFTTQVGTVRDRSQLVPRVPPPPFGEEPLLAGWRRAAVIAAAVVVTAYIGLLARDQWLFYRAHVARPQVAIAVTAVACLALGLTMGIVQRRRTARRWMLGVCAVYLFDTSVAAIEYGGLATLFAIALGSCWAMLVASRNGWREPPERTGIRNLVLGVLAIVIYGGVLLRYGAPDHSGVREQFAAAQEKQLGTLGFEAKVRADGATLVIDARAVSEQDIIGWELLVRRAVEANGPGAAACLSGFKTLVMTNGQVSRRVDCPRSVYEAGAAVGARFANPWWSMLVLAMLLYMFAVRGVGGRRMAPPSWTPMFDVRLRRVTLPIYILGFVILSIQGGRALGHAALTKTTLWEAIGLAVFFAGYLVAMVVLFDVNLLGQRIRTFVQGTSVDRRATIFAHAIIITVGLGVAFASVAIWYPGRNVSAIDVGYLRLLAPRTAVFIGGVLALVAILESVALVRTLTSPNRAYPGLRPIELPTGTTDEANHVIAHLSDLHVGEGPDGKTLEGKPAGNAVLGSVLTAHAPVLAKSDVVLITGDMTDAGTPKQWESFMDALPVELRARTVLVPGNHELNLADPTSATAVSDAATYLLRAVRFLAAARDIQGARTEIVVDGNFVPLDSYLDHQHAIVDQFAEGVRTWGGRLPFGRWSLRMARLWESCFPMRVQTGLVPVYVLNSNPRGNTVLSNAWGCLGTAQLERLAFMLRSERKPFVVGLHHHVGKASVPGFDGLVQRALSISDGNQLLELLTGRSCVVFNGHRHIRYSAVVSGATPEITVVAAPSTTFGDSVRTSDPAGFYSYGMRVDSDLRIVSEHFHPHDQALALPAARVVALPGR